MRQVLFKNLRGRNDRDVVEVECQRLDPAIFGQQVGRLFGLVNERRRPIADQPGAKVSRGPCDEYKLHVSGRQVFANDPVDALAG